MCCSGKKCNEILYRLQFFRILLPKYRKGNEYQHTRIETLGWIFNVTIFQCRSERVIYKFSSDKCIFTRTKTSPTLWRMCKYMCAVLFDVCCIVATNMQQKVVALKFRVKLKKKNLSHSKMLFEDCVGASKLNFLKLEYAARHFINFFFLFIPIQID